MIFNIGNAPIRKLPVLNGSYPQNVSANVGDNATFKVVIAEAGKPAEYTYQWYYDGNIVSGATGTSYTRKAEFGQHTVHCIVTNKAGVVVSRTAKLTADTQYLYKNGTIYPIAGDVKSDNGKNSVTKNSTSLHINSTGHNVWGHVYFTNPIDLTPYTTLYMVGKMTTTGEGNYWGQIQFGAFASLSSSAAAKIDGARAQGTHTIDVSKLKGNHYISTYLMGFANYAVADIQQVYLK